MAENIVELLTDVADAIREKKGSTEKINAQNFASEIRSIETSDGGSASGWTGHADAEGLRAIGWDDEDIAYYQAHGVNWNEEDDEYHKVTDDNKALYGVLTADNIQDYKARIVYLPKIDTSGIIMMDSLFKSCALMIAIPNINTDNVTSMKEMFSGCYCLTCVSALNTVNVTDMTYMFAFCYNLPCVPLFDTSNVTSMAQMFYYCEALRTIPSYDTSKIKTFSMLYRDCISLSHIKMIDAIKLQTPNNAFLNCISLTYVNIKNLNTSISFSNSSLLSKDSLIYMIENGSSTKAITITLASYAYERLAEDVDVMAALTAHPNVTLAI